MSKAKASLPRSIPFVYYDEQDNEVTHQIRKLPLGRAAELADAFNEFPKIIKNLMEGDETKVLFGEEVQDMAMLDMAVIIGNNLGAIIQVAQDAVVNILHIGSGLEPEIIESLGLDEVSELFLLTVQVNNLGAMQANLKNAVNLLAPNFGQKVQQEAQKLAKTQETGSKK